MHAVISRGVSVVTGVGLTGLFYAAKQWAVAPAKPDLSAGLPLEDVLRIPLFLVIFTTCAMPKEPGWRTNPKHKMSAEAMVVMLSFGLSLVALPQVANANDPNGIRRVLMVLPVVVMALMAAGLGVGAWLGRRERGVAAMARGVEGAEC